MTDKALFKEFEEKDPYNPENCVKGKIWKCNDKYGDLEIESINGIPCPQYIYTTPKFKYPGGVTSHFKMSPKFKIAEYSEIWIYDKIDGTNICLFRYKDKEGKIFTSYKTRLTPFLKESVYGNWKLLWDKCLEMYPEEFKKLMTYPNLNFGFELYGAINKVLTDYKVALDTRLLYAITVQEGKIQAPIHFTFEKPELIKVFDHRDISTVYDIYDTFLERGELEFHSGKAMEGYMIYCVNKETYEATAYKCKPLTVLGMQMESSSKFIKYADIYNTAINASESIESLNDLESETRELLKEEYSDLKIELSETNIQKGISEARKYLELSMEVIQKYKILNILFEKQNIGKIMKEIMKDYPKNKSSRVYGMINNYYIVFEAKT